MRASHHAIVAMLQTRPAPVSVEINIANANSAGLAQALCIGPTALVVGGRQ